MRDLAAARDQRAGRHGLRAQIAHDLGDGWRVEQPKQRHARHHSPGDDEFAAVNFLRKGGGDNADRQAEHYEAKQHGEGRDHAADGRHVAIADGGHGLHRPPHGGRDRAGGFGLRFVLGHMHR
jgi:hypothetical protein